MTQLNRLQSRDDAQAEAVSPLGRGGPFDPEDAAAYPLWRQHKLADYPTSVAQLRIAVGDLTALTVAELAAAHDCIAKTNMVLLSGPPPDGRANSKQRVYQLGAQFGLMRLDANLHADDDGITPLHVAATAESAEERRRARYIPYTDLPIRWHTDGYYNRLDQQVYGLLLYCQQDAAEGGINGVMDPEIAYIRLRDANPEWVRALMHPEVLTLPGNQEQGVEVRPDRTGPVFLLHPPSGALHMRYTRRSRNITWRNDPLVQQAVAALEAMFDDNDGAIFHHRLAPGEALVCNNVLHDRRGFRDDPATGQVRLIYRARYYDRIHKTPTFHTGETR